LTRLLSHRSHPAPFWLAQYRREPHRRRGRLRARRHPQGDKDYHPGVSHRPIECSLLCQCPLTRTCPLTVPPHTHPLQDRDQQHRRRGCLRARCRPQGDEDHHARVRRRPIAFALCQRPLTLLPSHRPNLTPMLCSISVNKIGDDGASALAAVLKETRISKLKCAPAPSVRFCVSAPLTRLVSHRPDLTHAPSGLPVAAWSTILTSATRPNRPSEMPRAAASALNSSTQPRAAWRMCSFKLRQGDWKGRGRCTLCTGKRPTGRIIFRAQRRTEIRGFLSFVNLCCAAVCGRGGDGWDRESGARRARSVTRNGCAVVSCFFLFVLRIYGMDYGRGCILSRQHMQKGCGAVGLFSINYFGKKI
jgi:hypothetical protein